MDKRTLLEILGKAQQFVNTKQRDHDHVINIMVGCFYILQQAVADWLDRKPERRRVLGDVRESYLTQRGSKVLRDLMALTISTVEACVWVKDWNPSTLPTPVVARTISREQQAKMQGGRKQNRKAA